MRSLAYFIGTFAVALLLGIGSAWYMIEQGSPLTTTKVGPWASWIALGNPTADPYTKAHLARSGRLPLSSTVARYFVARTDGAGHGLTSGCEYLDHRLADQCAVVVDRRSMTKMASLIENASNRYSFNNEEALRHADGSFRIRVARTARPENWLPSGDDTDRNLMLMLRIYAPRDTDARRRPHSRRPPAQHRARRMRVRIPGLYIVLGLVLAGPHPYRGRAYAADACAA